MVWKAFNRMAGESEMVLQLMLDGPFKRVRDDNHVNPHSILVWDRSRDPVIEAVDFLELLGRYPCGGTGSQWAPSDFTEILQANVISTG